MANRIPLSIVVLAALALIALASPRPGFAANVACSDFTDADCGGAAGDAFCDPGSDCINVGLGCECRPRLCCKCETEPGTTATTGACDLPCTQTGIGFLTCVAACALIDQNTPDSCNLKVLTQATCAGDSCPTTGCCTISAPAATTGPQAEVAGTCVETNAASCSLAFGTFIEGGSCAGGLDCACVPPTPTATPTSTPTATTTGTATWTGTPTHTPQPDGASCSSPSECSSTFCVDGICCNTACNQPFDTCNAPPAPGTCVQVAPAPPVSRRGLFAGLALLTLIGAAALWQQRRAFGGSSA